MPNAPKLFKSEVVYWFEHQIRFFRNNRIWCSKQQTTSLLNSFGTFSMKYISNISAKLFQNVILIHC